MSNVAQQSGQYQGGGQGEGNMRLRPSSQFHTVLKQDAAYLLQMYDKAYNAYLKEQQNVAKAKDDYYKANLRVSELNAEKQAIYAERSTFKNASEKWEAMHTGLNIEHNALIKERNKLSDTLSRASKNLLTAEQNLNKVRQDLLNEQNKNAQLEKEVNRLKSGTSAVIKAAYSERKQPSLYERIRSVPGRIVNLGNYPAGTPATKTAAGGAWLLAALFVIGRIE